MRCWNRKAPKGPLQHFRLILNYTGSVRRWSLGFSTFPGGRGLLKKKKKTKALTAVIDLTLRQYTFTDVEMCDYYHNAMLEQKGPEGAFTAL